MLDYKSSGVDPQKKEGSLSRLLEHVTKTFTLNPCRPLLPIGYYANVIDLRPIGFQLGIAFSTDGVGTKLLVAELMDRYDTVGIDCVAMNVNDILCVGATPLSMVDYIAVSEANAVLLEQVAQGLYKGCEMAGINLAGGELAQVAELLAHKKDKVTFDIVGTAIGSVDPEKVIVGERITEGDILVGLESNGLHSNGYTLARRICFDVKKFSVNQYIEEFGHTLGEELLRPTRIYVKEVLHLLEKVDVKGLFHITGDGFLNLLRTSGPVSYRIESFPEIPPVFRFLQDAGQISNEEMFRVFNMGIGFVIVLPDHSEQLSVVIETARNAGYRAHVLGHVVKDDSRSVRIDPFHIVSHAGSFQHQ
jgi:phosphoribosylformylglycinamidine cyclo-ligase